MEARVCHDKGEIDFLFLFWFTAFMNIQNKQILLFMEFWLILIKILINQVLFSFSDGIAWLSWGRVGERKKDREWDRNMRNFSCIMVLTEKDRKSVFTWIYKGRWHLIWIIPSMDDFKWEWRFQGKIKPRQLEKMRLEDLKKK